MAYGNPVMNAPSSQPAFNWSDPFLLHEQLDEDERIVCDSARQYCSEKLMPRVLEAHRHEPA